MRIVPPPFKLATPLNQELQAHRARLLGIWGGTLLFPYLVHNNLWGFTAPPLYLYPIVAATSYLLVGYSAGQIFPVLVRIVMKGWNGFLSISGFIIDVPEAVIDYLERGGLAVNSQAMYNALAKRYVVIRRFAALDQDRLSRNQRIQAVNAVAPILDKVIHEAKQGDQQPMSAREQEMVEAGIAWIGKQRHPLPRRIGHKLSNGIDFVLLRTIGLYKRIARK